MFLEARQWGLLGTYEKRLSAPETFLPSGEMYLLVGKASVMVLVIAEAPVMVLLIGEAPVMVALIGEAPVMVLLIAEAPEGIGEASEMSLLLYLSVCPLLTGSSCTSLVADIHLHDNSHLQPVQHPLLSIHSETNIYTGTLHY